MTNQEIFLYINILLAHFFCHFKLKREYWLLHI